MNKEKLIYLTEADLTILSVYTLFQFVPHFSQVHQKIEELLDRPVNTIEFLFEKVQKEIKEKCKPEYDKVINKIGAQFKENEQIINKEKEKIIDGIDVSEYFIDVVDEGGGTIDYKILPNSERLLVEKIFEQNQQLERLQEENAELYEKNVQLQKENEELKEKIHFKNLYKLLGKCFFDEARECHYFHDFVKTNQENKDLKEQVDDLVKDLKVQNGIIGKFEQALEEIRDRLIAVTEEEPQSTQNLVLDLKPIIEGVLNDGD